MRTTIDLPDQLLKQAKVTAIERGGTLRELIQSALEKELSTPGVAKKAKRLTRPLFRSKAPGALTENELTHAGLDAGEDSRHDGLLR